MCVSPIITKVWICIIDEDDHDENSSDEDDADGTA